MPRLPAGDVTLVFTDIEGSTRLARRLGPHWRALLQRHDELLSAAWGEHGGVLVKTEGDAHFVAFAEPEAAVSACITALVATADEPWADSARVRVRMGIHRGPVELVGADYVGIEVHKAARVAAAAHGGQLLLSGETAAALGDPPPGVSFRDLGRFALKDFEADGVTLVRADIEAVPTVTSAPRALPMAAHNLPVLRTTFIGRDVERIEIAKLLDTNALVTVVGPGGAGKSRLVIEVGRALTQEYPDGVWAAFLAGEARGADIVPAVAQALGVADLPDCSVAEAVAQSLAAKHLLLILDNCEHVLESTAALVSLLGTRCPGTVVLATSRQPLGVAGEKVWEIPALATLSRPASMARALEYDAVQLFVDRARDANAHFELTPDNVADVAALCRSLDGLPLALELAAALTRSVGLETLADRAERGTVTLRAPTADHERLRSSDSLIDWSYDMLDQTQQAIFRRTSVFRGGWTLDAAESVCVDGDVTSERVLDGLTDLVDRSLIAMDADGRYRMLVLIRNFAIRRLADSGEAEATMDRYINYFRSVASTYMAAGGAGSGSTFAAEVDNLRHAFDAAIDRNDPLAVNVIVRSLNRWYLSLGQTTTMDEVSRRALPLLPPDSPEGVDLRTVLASAAFQRGHREYATGLLDEVESAAMNSASRDTRAAFLGNRGIEKLSLGDPAAGADLLRAALDVAESVRMKSWLLQALGAALMNNSEFDEATAVMEQAMALLVEAGDEARAASARMTMAWGATVRGEVDRAVRWLEEALRLGDETGALDLRGQALYYASCITRVTVHSRPDLRIDGRRMESDAAAEAAALFREAGSVLPEAGCRVEQAIWAARDEAWAEAARHLLAGFPMLITAPNSDASSEALLVAALVLAAERDHCAPALAAAAVPAARESAASNGAADPVLLPRVEALAAANPGAEVMERQAALSLARDRLMALGL